MALKDAARRVCRLSMFAVAVGAAGPALAQEMHAHTPSVAEGYEVPLISTSTIPS
jgi:hypothetical protein